MQAIGYFSDLPRRPQDGQTRAGTLSQQNDAFLTYCTVHGAEPAASFLDTDLTGERPGFQQLLRYLDRPAQGFVTVVVRGFAHLGATPTEAARAYFQLTALGARVATPEQGDLTDRTVVQAWKQDAQAGGDPGARVRDAMRRRAVKGQALGRPPYGYRVGPDHRLELLEAEATLVRYIFRLHSQEGLGIRRIVKRLNAEGFRTRRDGNWSMVTIRDMLRNRAYLGTYARFGVKVPGSHPAIIAESDFHTVQDRMDSRRTPAKPARPGRYLLSGLVYCGDSDVRMIGVSRRQQWTRADGETVGRVYRYYQAESRTNQSVGDYHTRRADDLEAEVLRQLRGDTPCGVRPAVAAAGDARAVAAETAAHVVRTHGRQRQLDRRLAESLMLAAAGRLPAEKLRAVAAEVVEEHRILEEELVALQHRAQAQASDTGRRQRRERLLQRVRTEWDRIPFPERQAILHELIDRVVAYDDHVTTFLRP